MIGVIANIDEKAIVQEFFELFKTPWEFYSHGKFYDVLLCSGELAEQSNARLTVIYGAGRKQLDSFLGIEVFSQNGQADLIWNGVTFPVYTNMAVFECDGIIAITSKTSGKACAVKIDRNQHKIVRIGYDLFREISLLLSSGQSATFAGVPTLEIHIAILRELIIEARVPFVEIPPVPYGYDFITCLTHDIDFAGIRDHKFDRTMFGFFYRATFRTFYDALKGKIRWQRLWNNLKAVLLLPVVFLGIVRDYWIQFEKYLEVEKGLRSTFFFLPYKGVSGYSLSGAAPMKRAGKYDIDNLKEHIEHIISEGCEIGLHGIDVWNDSEKGIQETERITSVTGKKVYGVRIHWLYFNKESTDNLEKAGLMYDSTFGYNEAVGFFAGTAQVFRPLGSDELLELPLLIQDTAMFYSGRMGMSEDTAFILCRNVIKNVSIFGGVLVINWHGRSMAPERLWGEFYTKLLEEIKLHQVWFGTGSEVTQWFNKRRLARFSRVETDEGILKIKLEGLTGPDLSMKIYGFSGKADESANSEIKVTEIAVKEDMELTIPIMQL